MSYELHGFKSTMEASADLSASQFHFVELGATGVSICNVTGEHSVGVLNNDPDRLGAAAEIVSGGITKVVAGAAVTKGVPITTNGSGRAITAATGHRVHGTALEAAGANGEVIAVLLSLNGYIFP